MTGSGGHDILGDRPGFGDGFSVLAHAGNVKADRPADQLRSLSKRRSCSDAAGKIWDVRAVTGFSLFEKNGVLHFNPACLRILLFVFGSRSMDGCPATKQDLEATKEKLTSTVGDLGVQSGL